MATADGVDRLRAGDAGRAPASCRRRRGRAGRGRARIPTVDIVLCASSGTAALEAVLAAIEAGKTIALANKEVLVMAGALVTDGGAPARRGDPAGRQRAQRHPPVPARPRAATSPPPDPHRLGRTVPRAIRARRSSASAPDAALRHPTWQMGRKITIDSATLMNKGLEVIEAHWLFDVAGGSDRRRRSTRSRSCTRWWSSSTAR